MDILNLFGGGEKAGKSSSSALEGVMNKYVLNRSLENLREEGEALKGKESADDIANDIKEWFIITIATLRTFLPENSPIIEGLKELKDALGKDTQQPKSDLLSQGIRLLKVATELNRQRQDDQTMASLRMDLSNVMAETFIKSWWFKAPVAILILAASFTILGYVKIQNFKVDLFDDVKKASEKIKDYRESAEQNISTKLDSYLSQAQQKIDKGAKDQLELLKEKHAPALESGLKDLQKSANDLQPKFIKLQEDEVRLTTGINDLTNGLKRMDDVGKTRGLEQLSVFLNRSRKVVFAEIVIASCLLILSILLFWRSSVLSRKIKK